MDETIRMSAWRQNSKFSQESKHLGPSFGTPLMFPDAF